MATKETLKDRSDKELVEQVAEARKTIREEKFKDKFSRKANVIHKAKKTVARTLTELNARRNNKTN